MAEWWIYGQSVQRKKYPDGWIVFMEYLPEKGIYSIGMSKDIANRYDAYWTIFFKVPRETANRIFRVMKSLKASGYLDQYKPSGKEGISAEDKKAIARKVAEKIGQSFTIVIGDSEISIDPPTAQVDSGASSGSTGSVGGVQVGPGDSSFVFPGGTNFVAGNSGYAPPPRMMPPQVAAEQSQKSGGKKRWLFIGAGVLALLLIIGIAFVLMKKK